MRRLYAWWVRCTCEHHWHPIDDMEAWSCCWCDGQVDGWPYDKTRFCRVRFVRAEVAR